jgi:PAS domain S-box-containing protein
VLYLENQLAARVFTPARIAVLDLLASQAAISLENARLYADLQKENAERRQSEEALRRSEERYALAVRAAGDGHTDWIVATDELYASPRLLEMLGLPPDTTFAGRADFLARFNFHPEDRERAMRTLDDYYAGQSTRLDYEVRILRADETRWLHITVLCSRDATGAVQRSSSAITDITHRKVAEDALRVSEERFALAVAGANEGIFDWDLSSDRVYVSARTLELFGLPASDLARPRREWREILNFHSEDAKVQHDSIKALITGESSTYDVEFRIIVIDGSYRWFRQRGIALRDATGKAYRMVGSIGDITDRKRAQEDLLRLERRLRQAQRLEAMGTLAGGIAHDFNNILGLVLGFGERAMRDAPVASQLSACLDRIISAGERGRALVDRILAFSSNSAGERAPVHVEKVVAEALDLLGGRLPAGVRVEADLRAGRAAILGDPTQVHRVLMNLATNGVQAMPSGGVLRVSLAVRRVGEARLATVGGLEHGEYVVLTVADEGTGMPTEVLERIFDPFFTTKEVGIGTGLGLSLVHGIVANMEGAIDVTTAENEGTVFTVYLPRSVEVEIAVCEATPVLPRGVRQHVLLVDDEEALVVLAAETLEDLGYQPVGFTSSIAALEAFHADPGRFDAVITDERMPKMTGSAFIKAVRAVRPDVPILLMSGFVGGEVARRAREAGADEVLKKPLLERDLATSLARVFRR